MDASTPEHPESLLPATDSKSVNCNESKSPEAPIEKRSHKKRKSSDARLRKLWRRATTTPQGITSRNDWEELMELHSDWKARNSTTGSDETKDKYAADLPGPSISIRGELVRDFRNPLEWQSSKVADHRDILANLLFGGDTKSNGDDAAPSKKKRKKQKDGGDIANISNRHTIHIPSLPSWANICNRAGMGGMAVIEIDINDPDANDGQTMCSLMPSQFLQRPNSIWESMLGKDSTDTTKQQVGRIIGAACKVKMFQGDYPRCISDELMFLPPPPPSTLNGNNNENDLFKAISALRLSPKQIQSEGFPRPTRAYEQNNESSELCSKINKAKDEICMRANDFWGRFSTDEKADTPPAALRNTSDALKLVEVLSVSDVVCCTNEGIADSTKDELSTSEHYVKTFPHDKQRHPKVFALDCEMVQTSAGPELARVSVVVLVPGDSGRYSICEATEKTAVVLDELVKPRRPILDYLTEYSGITPKLLEKVSTRIEDIQAHLLSLIQESDMIVGHSLENDMKAIRMVHLNIVDTSIIFRGGSGRKYGLRHLTNLLLKKQIQSGVDGHCSTEDAEAALILATRRAALGPAFQLKENSRGKNIMRTFQATNREASSNNDSFAQRSTGPCVCIGNRDWISSKSKSDGTHHALNCDSILDSMSMAIPSWLSSSRCGRRSDFLWANLSCGETERSGHRENELKRLEEIMNEVYNRVPLHTPILMIFQLNYKLAHSLTKERKMALKSTAAQWTQEQEQKWQKCMDACMNCEALWIVGSTSTHCTA